jgi:hypothetical protein
MGAEYCAATIIDIELEMTNEQIKAAAQGVIEQAEYDFGHSGYSGSFAEKDSVVIYRDKVFDDEEAAERFIDGMDNSKWGPADVVPIKGVGWYMGGYCSS